jgi:phosphoglycolate phosphatase-like HAD superfamily hydrolase
MKKTLLYLTGLAVVACAPADQDSSSSEAYPSGTAGADVISNPLPSWNEGPSRSAIIDFVERTTTAGSPDFVPVPERIATFDNDGTLWTEQPAYFQLAFAIDRSKMIAAHNPELAENPLLKALASGDKEALANVTEHDLVQLVAETHSGMTLEQYQALVANWLDVARHPRFGVPYSALIYQPMLELLEYLRAHEYKTFIVSGGGVDFMRVFTEDVYGIPPEQVVGSMGETEFEIRDGVPVLVKQRAINFVDDKEGKPVGIARFIGRRPVMAWGNSDGDLAMLQYTMGGDGPRFAGYVHHDDPDREWAYDRGSHIGGFDKGWDEAVEKGWTVVSMRDEWQKIYPGEDLP